MGSTGADQAIADWSYRLLMSGAALAVIARAVLCSRDRLAWAMIGAGLVAWAVGDLYYDFVLTHERAIPYPSFSDALYFADYAALVCGVSLLTTRPAGARAFSLSILVTFLGLATVWSWVVFGAVIETAAGGTTAVATTLAYPLFDLFLLTSLLLALAARNWRLDRVLVCLAAGFAVTVAVDSIYAVQVAQGTYENNSVLTSLWPLGTLLIAAAAWVVPERASTGVQKSAGAIAPTFTTLAIAVAITALVWDHFWELGSLTILLAGLTLIAGCAQLAILYRGQKAAMARALRSERLRGASTRAALDCVITVDAEGIVREWNEAATRTFGYRTARGPRPRARRADHPAGVSRTAPRGPRPSGRDRRDTDPQPEDRSRRHARRRRRVPDRARDHEDQRRSADVHRLRPRHR